MEFENVDAVRRRLEEADYICSPEAATVVFLAEATGKPVLVEGPAGVGKTEEALQEAGVAFRKGVFHFRATSRARCMARIDGRVKMLADAGTDRLLGVHILGPHAGELIAEAAAAMAFGASSEDLARVCHAHPTLAEALKEAAMDVDKRAIHA